jgi:hypothetical protein
MSNHLKNITLRIWRQAGPAAKGNFETHVVDEITDEFAGCPTHEVALVVHGHH